MLRRILVHGEIARGVPPRHAVSLQFTGNLFSFFLLRVHVTQSMIFSLHASEAFPAYVSAASKVCLATCRQISYLWLPACNCKRVVEIFNSSVQPTAQLCPGIICELLFPSRLFP